MCSSDLGQAMGLTGQTYGNLMRTAGQAGMAGQNYAMNATNPYAVSSYMNPYLMNSLAPQMQLLGQQQAQQGQQLAGQATQAGAFGGSRYGLQEAERQCNLATQLGDIQATGSQAAFQQAQQQFNAEQQARLAAQIGRAHV